MAQAETENKQEYQPMDQSASQLPGMDQQFQEQMTGFGQGMFDANTTQIIGSYFDLVEQTVRQARRIADVAALAQLQRQIVGQATWGAIQHLQSNPQWVQQLAQQLTPQVTEQVRRQLQTQR